MKFVALVSGGKDSIFSIIECIRNGHELICCVHLGAPLENKEESFMYQTAGSSVVPVLVEECLGVPLILQRRSGQSVNQSLVYEVDNEDDEVEDLYLSLKKTLDCFPEIEAVSSGAILSNYQRVRIENVCNRLNLTSLSYLWRMCAQKELLERMLQNGIEAILVKTACPPGLIPSRHLGKNLFNLYHSGLFDRLFDRYKFHYCGEGGEYESLVVDCPIYRKRLILDDYDLVESNDGVGEMIVKACHAEDKDETSDIKMSCGSPNRPLKQTVATRKSQEETATKKQMEKTTNITSIPYAKRLTGGLIHFSEIISPKVQTNSTSLEGKTEGELAVDEALEVFRLLHNGLLKFDCKSIDVLFVHLYLSEISHFSEINKYYNQFFGTLLPPSRSCVALGKSSLIGGRRVMLDCMVQIGSGDFMRGKSESGNKYTNAALESNTSILREVLHVQSISHWAPVCVGPYSQVNTFRSGIHFIAGQIGLDPPTMKLKEGWIEQLKQSWCNLAHILDALEGGSLDHLMSCLLYLSPKVTNFALIYKICCEMISTNAYFKQGTVDSYDSMNEMYDGYEDEETWREMTKEEKENAKGIMIPFLMITIPEMPVGALVEIEATAVTKRAASSLHLELHSKSEIVSTTADEISPATKPQEWNAGYDFPIVCQLNTCQFHCEVNTVSIGSNCAAMTTAVIYPQIEKINGTSLFYEPETILSRMFNEALRSVTISTKDILHVRLYFLIGDKNDGDRWRYSLANILAAKTHQTTTPAVSIIPVFGMKFVCQNTILESPLVSIQMLTIDPVHLETELWLYKKREGN